MQLKKKIMPLALSRKTAESVGASVLCLQPNAQNNLFSVVKIRLFRCCACF